MPKRKLPIDTCAIHGEKLHNIEQTVQRIEQLVQPLIPKVASHESSLKWVWGALGVILTALSGVAYALYNLK